MSSILHVSIRFPSANSASARPWKQAKWSVYLHTLNIEPGSTGQGPRTLRAAGNKSRKLSADKWQYDFISGVRNEWQYLVICNLAFAALFFNGASGLLWLSFETFVPLFALDRWRLASIASR